MDVTKAIIERRAVKHFDPTHEMPAEEFERMMTLAMESPTSFNIQAAVQLSITKP